MKLMPYIMPERELTFCLTVSNLSLQSKALLTFFLTIKIYFVKKVLHIKKGSPQIKWIAREGIRLFQRLKVAALAIYEKCRNV